MKYVIGIDGGGTKAHMCAADPDGNLLFEDFGGGTNLCSMPEAEVTKTLEQLLGNALRALESPPQAVCIGSAGIVMENSVVTMQKIIREITGTEQILVLNDAQIALAANLGDAAGISIIAGTGSICLARSESGDIARLSGWGHIFSDEGSAYYIASRAMVQVCMAHDRRIPPTIMEELFLKQTGCADFDALISTLYTEYGDKKKFASLARLVDIAAASLDNAAIAVLDDAAFALFSICQSAAAQTLEPLSAFRVVQNGGVFVNSTHVREKFGELMRSSFPNCSIEIGTRKAVWGAVDLALKHAV